MKRFWILIPLLFLTLSLIPSEQADAHSAHFSPNLTALELLAEVNDLRTAKKLTPYKTNSTLMKIAQSQANYISSAGVMTRFNAEGTPPYQRAIAASYSVAGDLSQGGLFFENIGSGTGLTVSGMVELWQDDADDMQTMVSADLQDVGAGVAIVDGVTYYVLDAGASTSSLPVTGTPTVNGTPLTISTPLEDGTVYHLVQANEALWSIALNYNVTVDQLKLLNSLSTDDIYEGQKLLIQKPVVKTATPTVIASATFGIPTSTATLPVTPTAMPTATPLPVPPTSRQNGQMVVGIIILVALFAAGIGAWLGSKKTKLDS